MKYLIVGTLNEEIYMYLILKSLKGLTQTLRVMAASPKQVFVLASGLTGIFTSGYLVSQIPYIYVKQVEAQETTKQMQETTKQMQETTKQMQERTKQMELELEILKLKRRWWFFG